MSVQEVTKPIIVGVDGSADSYGAIERALEEAARRSTGVRLVHAFDYTFVVITPVPGGGFDQMRQGAEAVLRDAVAAAEGRGVPVEGVLGYGPPAAVLLEESERAAMLVVGRWGRSAHRSSSGASVASACARRAACPVEVAAASDCRRHRRGALVGAASR